MLTVHTKQMNNFYYFADKQIKVIPNSMTKQLKVILLRKSHVNEVIISRETSPFISICSTHYWKLWREGK